MHLLPSQVHFPADPHQPGSMKNTVIDCLHHFLNNCGDGETDVVLHCDNCRGSKQEQFGAVLLCLLDCEPPSPEEDGSCVQALALPRALDCSASGIPEWTLCQTLLGL